ncbi:MAG: DUF364 domain-containing protein [Proteobacteria bacterium]|nr:DUF364 domain-containing protein [Pseudomonadota bacterium]
MRVTRTIIQFMIHNQLKEYAAGKAHDTVVTDVRIGLCYTAVILSDGAAGVAYTFKECLPPGCDVFQGRRPLAGKKASDILQYLTSADLLERAVGIATANALINRKQEGLLEGDILDVLDVGTDDRVGMVGYFPPLMPLLKPKVRELLVFEKLLGKAPGVYPEHKATELLPSCSVAIITATSLINETLQPLLEACRTCRQVALLGASTPLAPELFKPFGVTLLSGIIITDACGVLRCVSEGGGMGSFKGYIKKVNLPVTT